MTLLHYGLSRSKNTPKENPYKIGDVLHSHGKKCKVVGFGKTQDSIKVEQIKDGQTYLILWYQSDEILRPETLIAYEKALQDWSMQPWRNRKLATPYLNKKVMVVLKDGSVDTDKYIAGEKIWSFAKHGSNVAYWMPFPPTHGEQ